MNRTWLVLTVPVAVVAIGALTWTVRSLIRTVRGSVVLSVPAVPEQPVRFSEAGRYSLNARASSRLTSVAGLRFSLEDAASGRQVPLDRTLVRTTVSSASGVRLELYGFTIVVPGTYLLRIQGEGPDAAAGLAIVFTRRYTPALVLHVLAIVALGALFIGSLVATALALTVRRAAAAEPGAAGVEHLATRDRLPR